MEHKCKCPLCDKELIFQCMEPVFCQSCDLEFVPCKHCGEMYNVKLSLCPKCGGKNERKNDAHSVLR